MLYKHNRLKYENQTKLKEFNEITLNPLIPRISQKQKIDYLISKVLNKNARQLKYSVDIEPSEEIKINPYYAIERLTPSQKATLLSMAYMILRYSTVFVSQSTIARKNDISREHANRSISLLTELGFLSKVYRGVKKTCLYSFSSYFRKKENARKLIQLLSPAKIFSIALLTVLGVSFNAQSMDIVTQHKNRYMNLIDTIYSPSTIITKLQQKYNLSQTAVIKLMVFPDQAINYVVQKIQEMSLKPKDPIAYIISQLKEYCQREDIKPNWSIFYKLMELKKIPLASSNYLAPLANDLAKPQKSDVCNAYVAAKVSIEKIASAANFEHKKVDGNSRHFLKGNSVIETQSTISKYKEWQKPFFIPLVLDNKKKLDRLISSKNNHFAIECRAIIEKKTIAEIEQSIDNEISILSKLAGVD